MISASKPRWQQVTALVSLSASGTITGFSFVPSAPADLTAPASMPIRLMALERSATAPADDSPLRSAIVNVANYYLRMAQTKTPAEMEAIIWQHDSLDGVDHGESCAAFASMTLELAAQVVGQQSWVTGGSSYPWPLHQWADVRVDPNPDSLNIISVLQDAQAHGRWHPLGDGYVPQPGDWVLFDGHVEVVTKYAGGVLSTIGGDSLPNFSVNAHEYSDPLGAQGVVGFVNNGDLTPAAASTSAGNGQAQAQSQSQPQPQVQASSGAAAIPGDAAGGAVQPAAAQRASSASIPGMPAVASSPAAGGASARPGAAGGHWHASHGGAPASSAGTATAVAEVPGAGGYSATATAGPAAAGSPAIPGLPGTTRQPSGPTAAGSSPYQRHQRTAGGAPAQATSAQQAFINAIAPGAMATQRRFGVPAAVTIAQAIDESGWGQSTLAVNDHNLFGIKGTGPAGSDVLPTQEFENGQWVTINSGFRVYHNFAESIEDHGELLATSGYYTQAMGVHTDPDAFANALTGVYATNPSYGTDLIQLMQQYNLYRYDATAPPAARPAPRPSTPRPAATPRPSRPAPSPTGSTAPAGPSPAPSTPQPPPSAPSPTVPQPSPTVRQPSPTATSPGAATTAPSTPTPSTPTPSASQPAAGQPGPSGTSRASSPNPAATAPPATTAPAAGGGSPSIPGLWPTAPGPSGIAPEPSAGAPQTRGGTGAARASQPSPAPSRPTSGASPEPATQSFSYQHLSADTSTIHTTSLFRPTAPTAQTAPTAPTAPAAGPDQATARLTRGKPIPKAVHYRPHLPPSVKNAFAAGAKAPLVRAELLYRDVAERTGIPWQVLAACDWMQCEARPRYSPVHGEKLGTVNLDGTAYRTKSAALEQCAYDLIDLAGGVYGVDLTAPGDLSVSELALVFAAFRWGGLLKQHHTSAMEFPYSVAGLTIQHLNMRWPRIDESQVPDKPGARFRRPFGAVPVVLSLNYPAIA